VSSTLGPSGRNVIIENEDGTIQISKDGVTCARSFKKLEDPIENIGIQLVKRVSEKSVDAVGDGTTTSTLLTSEIVAQGIKAIQQGSNPVEVARGISKAVKEVVKSLKDISEEISTEDQIKQVAFISANSDAEIAELIRTAIDKVGEEGIVTIEESKSGETTLEVVEGMMIERGLKSPYLVTKNEDMAAVLEKPLIFLCDERILSTGQLLNVLQAAAQANKPLLIVAEDIDGEALALLIVNKMRGMLKVAAVKAPDYGDRRTAILEDLAVLTGATVVSSKKGHKLDKISISEYTHYFGEARMVNATMKDTTIIDGKGDVEKIEERLSEIKSLIEKPGISAFEKEKYQERLGKMTGGVAIINVGGMSEIEMKEKKDRVDDALHATKAALLEGVVPGGGMALILASKCLESLVMDNRDQELGRDIIKKSLYAPFKKILNNAGIDDHYSVLSDVIANRKENNDDWVGYDVKKGEICNFKEFGILDPTKVTRTAIENASSVAATILTTESLIYMDETKESKNSYDEPNDYI
jgi:chaperonin GroEL